MSHNEEEDRFERVQAFELASANCQHALDDLSGVKGVKRIRATLERLRDELDEKAQHTARADGGSDG